MYFASSNRYKVEKEKERKDGGGGRGGCKGTELPYTAEPTSEFMIMGGGECSIGPRATVETFVGFLFFFSTSCLVSTFFAVYTALDPRTKYPFKNTSIL